MNEAIPSGWTELLSYLEGEAKKIFPEESKLVWHSVKPSDIVDAIKREPSDFHSDRWPMIDIDALSVDNLDEPPLFAGASVDQFLLGSIAPAGSLEGLSAREHYLATFRGSFCSHVETIRRDILNWREGRKAELRIEAFAKRRDGLYVGRIKAALLGDDGVLKKIPKRTWYSKQAIDVVRSGVLHGKRVLIKAEMREGRPIEGLVRFFENRGKGQAMPKDVWKREAKDSSLVFEGSDFDAAYRTAIENGFVKLQIGAPTKAVQSKRGRSAEKQ